MAGKLPAFQFYPKDWQADSVFGCSLAARGLWHEMMNVMHGCEPYGHLAENGRPMADERIARKCGATPQEYAALLAELDAAGVPRRTRVGIIYSKRMVEDQRKRKEWRKRQQKHRDNTGPSHGPVTRDVTRVSRPSSSSSSSSKKEKAKSTCAGKRARAHAAASPLLQKFCDDYPPHRRLDLRKTSREFSRLSETDQVRSIESLAAFKSSAEWQDEGGKFVPASDKFLKQRRFEHPPVPGRQKGNAHGATTRRSGSGLADPGTLAKNLGL